jgi:hypothetical protein
MALVLKNRKLKCFKINITLSFSKEDSEEYLESLLKGKYSQKFPQIVIIKDH